MDELGMLSWRQGEMLKMAPDVHAVLCMLEPELSPLAWMALVNLYLHSENGQKYVREFSLQAAHHIGGGNRIWRNPSQIVMSHVKEKFQRLAGIKK